MSTIQTTTTPSASQDPDRKFVMADAITALMPMAEKIAQRYYYRFPKWFDLEDLTGYAYLGLARAGHTYQMSEAVDFADHARKHVLRAIQGGVHEMAMLHRRHWRMVNRGQMAKPTLHHDVPDFDIADALMFDRSQYDEPLDVNVTADEMLTWLRKRDDALAEIVELHVKGGLSLTEVAEQIGKTRGAVCNLYRRAVNELTRKFNPAAWEPLDSRETRRLVAEQRACA